MINQRLIEVLGDMDLEIPVRIDGIRAPLDVFGVSVRTGEDGKQYIALQTAPRSLQSALGDQGNRPA